MFRLPCRRQFPELQGHSRIRSRIRGREFAHRSICVGIVAPLIVMKEHLSQGREYRSAPWGQRGMASTTSRSRAFYIVMACAAALIAVVGFSRRYFLALAAGTLDVSAIVHFQGLIMFAWVAFLLCKRYWSQLDAQHFTAAWDWLASRSAHFLCSQQRRSRFCCSRVNSERADRHSCGSSSRTF